MLLYAGLVNFYLNGEMVSEVMNQKPGINLRNNTGRLQVGKTSLLDLQTQSIFDMCLDCQVAGAQFFDRVVTLPEVQEIAALEEMIHPMYPGCG